MVGGVNASQVASDLTNAASQAFSPFAGIIKAVGIVIIIYFIFLIIKGI